MRSQLMILVQGARLAGDLLKLEGRIWSSRPLALRVLAT